MLTKRKWHLGASGYAQRTERGQSKIIHGTGKVMLHRLVIKTPKGMYTDHINGNKLDNRKCNLRICKSFQNAGNSKNRSDNTSGTRGVHFCKQRRKYVAQISIHNKIKNLGRFDTMEEARLVYRTAAINHFGEFAKI